MHPLPGGLRWAQLLYAPMAAILFLAGFSIARGYDVHITLRDRAEASHLYTPTFWSDPGPQLVMVYIGSATCPWSIRLSTVLCWHLPRCELLLRREHRDERMPLAQ